MKKLLFCLLSGTVLAFSSCQSEDPVSGVTNGSTTTPPANGKAVNFTYGGSSASVRTYYHTDGSLRWSNEDKIRVVSPILDESGDDHQHAHYTIVEEDGGKAAGSFEHSEETELADPIYWNTAETQHFYAYYPAESVVATPTAGRSAITDIDPVSGSAVYHVPANQSLTARIASSVNESNPLAYAMAANKGVSTEGGSPVQLQFHDFMNVLRIHVNNPNRKLVKGVKVSTTVLGTTNNLSLSGTVHVSLNNTDSHAAFGHLDYTIPAEGYSAPDALNALSNEIQATAVTASEDVNLYYDIYLLPQQYAEKTLQVTVMMGNDDSPINDLVKVVKEDFAKSSIKRVRFDTGAAYTVANDYGIKMVDIIPRGRTFVLGGATDSYPGYASAPTARLSAFQIATHEFTQGQWDAVVKDAIKALQSNTGAAAALRTAGFSMDNNNLLRNGTTTGMTTSVSWPRSQIHAPGYNPYGENYPIFTISHDELVNVFIPLLNALTNKNYDLPTEVQWEYAARDGSDVNDWAGATGGDGIAYRNSADMNADLTELNKVAWTRHSDYSSTAKNGTAAFHCQPVGLLRPTSSGLYDMSGNVEEWCKDWFATYPSSIRANYFNNNMPNGSNPMRATRGGSATGDEVRAMVHRRGSASPSSSGSYTIGFRLVIFNGSYNTPVLPPE